MQSRSDLADFVYFLAIARNRSISGAAKELGLSASAISHALKGLEARLGIRLINRTTRSVTLTAAGEELCTNLTGPMAEIGSAVDALNRYREAPSGRIRLNAPNDAAVHLLAPVIPVFTDRYPEIDLEISISNRMIDVIDGGYDAGIRFGGTVPEDMIAQRVSAEIRWVVVGSPDYIARFGAPRHPDELHQHRCLRIRSGTGHIYKWEFERGDEELEISVPGAITIDEANFAMALVKRGAGLVYGPEPAVRDAVEAGQLQIVLQEWLPSGPAYHVYYSGRRHVPAGLRALIDLIRELRPLGL